MENLLQPNVGSQGPMWGHKVLCGVTRSYVGSQGSMWGHKVICGVTRPYRLLAVITEVAQWGTPSCSRPQSATENGVGDGRPN